MFLRHKRVKSVFCPKSAEAVTETGLEHCNYFVWGADKIQGSPDTKGETQPQKYGIEQVYKSTLEGICMAPLSRKPSLELKTFRES